MLRNQFAHGQKYDYIKARFKHKKNLFMSSVFTDFSSIEDLYNLGM